MKSFVINCGAMALGAICSFVIGFAVQHEKPQQAKASPSQAPAVAKVVTGQLPAQAPAVQTDPRCFCPLGGPCVCAECNCGDFCTCGKACPGKDSYKSIESTKPAPEVATTGMWEEWQNGWFKSKADGSWKHDQYGTRPASFSWNTPAFTQPQFFQTPMMQMPAFGGFRGGKGGC